LMAISADIMDIDLVRAAMVLKEEGHTIKKSNDMELILDWNGIETTIFSQGKVMFMPLQDRTLCVKYATEILEMVR
jgi:hypothetical protein